MPAPRDAIAAGTYDGGEPGSRAGGARLFRADASVREPLEFGVLGPIEVRRGAQPIELRQKMKRTVLGILVLNANRVVSVDQLTDQLWDGNPPPTAATALHVHISGLRRVLEPDRVPRAPSSVLVRRPPGYSLCLEPDAVDAIRFESLAARGRALLRSGRPAAAADALSQALALWRGAAYEDLAFEPFAAPDAARLTELRAGAAEDHAEANLGAARHAEAVTELEALVADDPLRERRWQLMALALYRDGRQAEALRTLSRARRTLREEIGVEPGPELRRLEEDMLIQSPALLAPGSGSRPAPPWHRPRHCRTPRSHDALRVREGSGLFVISTRRSP